MNHLPDIVARYSWHIWALAILIISLAALSIFLFKSLSKSKRTEAALSTSEANLKSTQAVARMGGFIINIPYDKLTWFEGTSPVIGVPIKSQFSYGDFLRIIHPDDRNFVDTNWQAALKGSPSDIEYRIIVADELKWVRTKVEVEFDRMGQPLLAKGFLQDITRGKRSEEEAARLRHDLAHVARVATVGDSATTSHTRSTSRWLHRRKR